MRFWGCHSEAAGSPVSFRESASGRRILMNRPSTSRMPPVGYRCFKILRCAQDDKLGVLSLQRTHESLPLEGKVVSEANRMRWRRKESCPRPAPSSVACGDSLFCGAPSAVTVLARECAAGAFLFWAHSPGGSLSGIHRTKKSPGRHCSAVRGTLSLPETVYLSSPTKRI